MPLQALSRWASNLVKGFKRLVNSPRPHLKSYEEEHRKVHILSTRYHLHPSPIAVGKIVGSVGRHQDYDSDFYPFNPEWSSRWKPIVRAMERGAIFPPIDVYKLGDEYYVIDGHHRVSAAKLVDAVYIDANVIEMVIEEDGSS